MKTEYDDLLAQDTTSTYTVILLRPEDISSGPTDTYTTVQEAESPEQAIRKAQVEAFRTDMEDDLSPERSADYYPLAVMAGEVEFFN